MKREILAFFLTLLAGLATGIGSFIALSVKKNSKWFLTISLGFSAGVMIYASMIEIFWKGKTSLVEMVGQKNGSLATVTAFFGGMLVIWIIDKLIPCPDNNRLDSINNIEEEEKKISEQSNSLFRMGIFTALAMAIHNFPEGLATFMSGLQGVTMALPITVAIALHNIPEGIAVAVPIYFATGNKKKAFIYSFLSGLTEPLGAIIGYLILKPFINGAIMGVVFASVAGIMVFISLDELLPSAWKYGTHKLSMIGLISGMIVMAISLCLFL